MDMDMDMDMGNSSSGMMMMMYFNFMMPFTVVFKGWDIQNDGQLIGSCFGVAAMAMVYEILKNLRQLWANKMVRKAFNASRQVSPSTSDCCHDDHETSECSPPRSGRFWLAHLFQSILHMVQVFLAYLLMLIVMTYNVWLVISIILGAGVGHLLAGGIYVKPDDVKQSKSNLISTRVEEKGYEATKSRNIESYAETSSSEMGSYDNEANTIKE